MSRFVPVSFEKWAEMVKAQSDLVRYKEMCDELDAECTRLKAEVEELKSQPDPLTAYLYADTLRRDDIKTLKAHIELLTYVGDAMAMMVGHVEVKGDAHRMMLEFSKEWLAAKEGKQP